MSQPCSVNKCIRRSRGLCDCCQKVLCLQHLSEHNALLVAELNPFTDEINTLRDRLKTFSIQNTTSNGRQKLQQWREDCHKKIDCFFEKKCQELDQIINGKVEKHRKKLNDLHSKITDLINTQETTREDIDSLNSAIRHLKSQMNKVEQQCFTIDTRPLVIDDSFVVIQKKSENEVDLSTLPVVYTTIKRPEKSFGSLASNARHLLLHRHPHLCLFDREIKNTKQTLWTHGTIQDMCWSRTLDRFVILGVNSIFLFNENTVSVDEVQTINERRWLSCTCSDTVLFVSTNELGSSIMEFALAPVIKYIREWKPPLTCTKDEDIDDIVYHGGNLALMTMNNIEKSLRIELRYARNLNCIWSIPLDIKCVHSMGFHCCILTCDECLIVDYETGRLLQITKDGKMKKKIQYGPSPCRATLFGKNTLAVVTYDHSPVSDEADESAPMATPTFAQMTPLLFQQQINTV
ncbi:unnamed protein product [Rotaria socialis]